MPVITRSRMLVVEDDAVTRELLQNYFTTEGFEVFTHSEAEGCPEFVVDKAIDICLIDIRLPGRDGLTLTHEIRDLSSVGIILVTGKDELIDRIVGLESGADDYVTKPFEMRELLSRVKNVLRRTKFVGPEDSQHLSFRFSDWTLDTAKRSLLDPDNTVVVLSEGEYQLLHVLLENRGQVMTRDHLMQKIRNIDWNPDDRYIDVLVVKLRQKFRSKTPDETFVKTVHGHGYLFQPEVNLI